MLKQEGYDLIGACMEVYNTLGYGLYEEVYQQSLEIELELRGIPYNAKQALKTHYKGRLLNKIYIPDLVVYNQIITELKSVNSLNEEHEAQLLNYLRLANTKVGYLVNFGHKHKLEWKRFIIWVISEN